MVNHPFVLSPKPDNYKLYNAVREQVDLIDIISEKLPDIPISFIISAIHVVSNRLTNSEFHLYDFHYIHNKTIYEIHLLFGHRSPYYTSKRIESLNNKFIKLIGKMYQKI